MSLPRPGRAAARLLRDRALTAADTWERHLIVAELVGDARQVVDVGGLPGQLSDFIPRAAVLAANVVPPADLLVPADGLPFKDRSIEVLTSLDALEHVPPAGRAAFVADLVRVARRRVVLCCPFGTDAHVAAEREIQAWHREVTGQDHPWLSEHLENGLPTRPELEQWFGAACEDGDRVSVAFHGDFAVTNEQFKLIVTARRRPRPRSVAAFARRRLTHVPDTRLSPEPQPRTNRVFVCVDRAPLGSGVR